MTVRDHAREGWPGRSVFGSPRMLDVSFFGGFLETRSAPAMEAPRASSRTVISMASRWSFYLASIVDASVIPLG